jgi:small subunit ribosomal protein S16
MLTIRLLPMGKAHQIKYRLAIVEGKSKLTGDPREVIGHFEPKSKTLKVDRDRLSYWLAAGAQPSDRIRTLLDL